GNIEYLLHLQKDGGDAPDIRPETVVARAHEELR
ncbi:MAG: TlyA family RNA methyltransferase, partial [Lachnospiraceae bacterium]|nr:TlyA family RNA methyltransferase [Lachnospiraceae bacterium]